MKPMLASLFLLSVVASALPEPPPVAEKGLIFVFLTKGDAPRPEREVLVKMQAAHIENFGRKFAEGKLIAAGPLQDPTQMKRGIVVLTVDTFTKAADAFDEDPYVQTGIMRLDMAHWDADPTLINTKLKDTTSVLENRLVLFRAKRELTAAELAAHRRRMDQIASIYGRLQGPGPYRSVGLFAGVDPKLEAALKTDPLIRTGALELEMMPLWMSKDVIRAK